MSVVQEKPSTNAIVALVLGIASFFGFSILTGIPAWILGKRELTAIDRGAASATGRTMAAIGMWLGIAATVLTVLALIAFLLLAGGILAVGTNTAR